MNLNYDYEEIRNIELKNNESTKQSDVLVLASVSWKVPSRQTFRELHA